MEFTGIDDLTEGFVARLEPDGDIIWSSFLGGDVERVEGGAGESANSIAIDPSGDVWIAGWTSAADFPLKNAIQTEPRGMWDAFLTKVTPDGQLLYSTFLGGGGRDTAVSVVPDSLGNVWVAGGTDSVDFPLRLAFQDVNSGLYDGFITKVDSSGIIQWSSYFGGSDDDSCMYAAVDEGGALWVGGSTRSPDLPLTGGFQEEHSGGGHDAFLVRFAYGASRPGLCRLALRSTP